MKKFGTVLLLVFTLIASSFTVYAQESESMTLQNRLSNQELNIIDSFTEILIDESGKETDDRNTSTQARLTYFWSLAPEDSMRVEKGDTFTFNLDDKYTNPEVQTGLMSEFGSFTLTQQHELVLTFDENTKSADAVKGSVEFLVNTKTIETEEIPVVEEPIVPTEPIVPAEPEKKAMSLEERMGRPVNIIDSATFEFFNVIDGKLVEAKPPTINSEVGINIKWNFTDLGVDFDRIQPNDYYDFKLPDAFTFEPNSKGNLANEAGLVFGEFELDALGNIRFIFNHNAASYNKIEGFVKIYGKINSTDLDGPGKIEVKVPFNEENNFSFIVAPEGSEKSVIKNGTPDKTYGTSTIVWDVEVNKGYAQLEGVVVEDTISDLLKLDKVDVYKVAYSFDGTLDQNSKIKMTEGVDYDLVGGKVSFKKAIDTPYLIQYHTSVTDAVLDNDEKNDFAFYNEVKLTYKGGSDSDHDTVNSNYGKYLNKVSKKGDDDRSVNWSVDFNQRNKNLGKINLVDTFNSNMTLDSNTVKIFTQDGEPYTGKYTVLYTEGSNTFTLEFDDVTEGLKINYTTKLKDGFINIEGQELKNKITDGNLSTDGSYWLGVGILEKRHREPNYKDRTIDWSIAINKEKQSISNVVLDDTYVTVGLTMQADTFMIINNTTNAKLIKDQDYKLVMKTKDGIETGFTVEFLKDNYNSFSDALTVSYTTDFDVSASLPAAVTEKLINQANIQGISNVTKEGFNVTVIDSVPLRTEAVNNGDKKGTYNPITKEITWSVFANFNGDVLKDASIKDTIDPSEKYITDSLTVYKYTINENGDATVDRSVQLNNYITQKPNESNKFTFIVSLPEGSTDKFYVEFKTSLENTVIKNEYLNTATFTNDTIEKILTGKTTVNHGGNLILKKGSEKPNSVIGWEILINRSQSHIDDAVINDTPSNNQILVSDSFKLYKGIVQADGEFIIDETKPLKLTVDYDLDIVTNKETGQQNFKLTFKPSTIKDMYVLRYDSVIHILDGNNEISNKYSLSGNNTDYVNDSGKSGTSITVNGSTGGASGVQSRLTIQKTNEKGLPLEGVEFDLIHRSGNIIATEKTDKDGKITFNRLIYGTYRLQEKETLPGYIISDKLFNGTQTVEVTEETSNNNTITAIVNKMNKLTITKVNDKGVLIKGARFKLENLTTGETQEVDVIDGSLTLLGLPAGPYRLTEIKAADGYILNTDPKVFKIEVDKNGQALETTNVEFVNYKGTYVLTKQGLNNTVLKGVKFDLFKKGVEQKIQTYTTDKDGTIRIEDLSPGAYTLYETESVDGYIINTDKIEFTVAQEFIGMPPVQTQTVANHKASITLEKEDKEGNKLAGAQFGLFAKENPEIEITNAISDANGLVTFTNVNHGTYIIRETQAPKGFIINSTEIEVTVDTSVAGGILSVPASDKAIVNYKGSYILRKIDDKKEILAGVSFDLYKEDGTSTYISSHVTNAKGLIKVENLAPGNYAFLETRTLPGYILDTDKVYFTIESSIAGEPVVNPINRSNYKGSLTLSKVDTEKTPLAGVEFGLFSATDDSLVDTAETDLNGILNMDTISVGEYYLQETKALDGFILNSKKMPVSIVSQMNGKFEVINLGELVNYKGSARLQKTDFENKPLENVTFDLYSVTKEDKVHEALTTDAQGLIEVTDLAPGAYYFKETMSARGNIINTEPIEFTIANEINDAHDFKVRTSNNTKAAVTFTKEDSKGNPLAGVVFELFQENGDLYLDKEENDQFTSDVNGVVRVENLEPGSYYFKEVATLKGYMLSNYELHFEIADATDKAIVEKSLGTFVNYKGSIEISKKDTQGKSLEGVTFDLYNKADDERLHKSLKTDENGRVIVENLEPGTYYFIETQSVEGNIIPSQAIEFTIATTHDEQAPKHETIEITNHKGSVRFTKVDVKGNPLEGSEFNLYNEQGLYSELIYTSDVTGQVLVENLPVGSYYFKEVSASANYLVNTLELPFEIVAETLDGTYQAVLDPFTNYKGSVELTKTDFEQKALAGVRFDLYDANDTRLSSHTTQADGTLSVEELAPGAYYFIETESAQGHIINTVPIAFTILDQAEGIPAAIRVASNNTKASVEFFKKDIENNPLSNVEFTLFTSDDVEVTTVLSDDTGKVRVDNLAPSKYYFVETKAKEGFVLNTERITFTIKKDTVHEAVLETLPDFINYQGSLRISKVSANGTLLEEASFIVRDSNNTIVAEQQTVKGILEISKLAPGAYTVQESVAPKGYVLDTKAYSFDVPEQFEGLVETEELAVVNYPESVHVPRTPDKLKPGTSKPETEQLPNTGISKDHTLELGSLISALGLALLGLKLKRKED